MADNRKPIEKDFITNKVLMVFTLCLFGIFGLIFLYRLISHGNTYGVGHTVVQVVLWIGVALLLAGVGKTIREHQQHADVQYSIWRGRNISIVAAVVVVCMLVIQRFGPTSIKLFYIILPALAIYYLIYHSYLREFFIISLDCGVAAVLLSFARRALNSANYQYAAYACAAVALVIALAQFYVLRKVQNGKQVEGIVDGRRTQLFASAHAYQMMYVSALLLVLFVALGAIAGAQVAYYLLFAVFGYLFITAVYYTVKMM